MDGGLVLLYSGGFDSNAVLLDYLTYHEGDVHLLYFGFEKNKSEIEVDKRSLSKLLETAYKHFPDRHVIINEIPYPSIGVNSYTDDGNLYFPNRNMIMISMAVAYAMSEKIPYVGIGIIDNGVDSFSDSTLEFATLMNSAIMESSEFRVQLYTPFGKYDKQGILNLFVPWQQDILINHSSHCYNPVIIDSDNYETCGECGGCKDFKTLYL